MRKTEFGRDERRNEEKITGQVLNLSEERFILFLTWRGLTSLPPTPSFTGTNYANQFMAVLILTAE